MTRARQHRRCDALSQGHAMNRTGFTLIELVMVIVLIGILVAYAAPKLLDMTTTKAGSFVDKLRVDIRFAQNLAMTRNLRSRVYFNGTGGAPASGYAVVSSTTSTCSAFTNPFIGGPLTVTLGSGDYANISIVPSMNCLEYDSLGRPYNCTIAPAPAACSTTLIGMAITVQANAAPVGTVTITPQTGAIN
jgi:prepilin-type N-terminal cleavage/methylation domain-containing protein